MCSDTVRFWKHCIFLVSKILKQIRTLWSCNTFVIFVFPSKELFFFQKSWKKKKGENSSAAVCWYRMCSMSRCLWYMWKSDSVCYSCYLVLLLSGDIQGRESRRLWSLSLGRVDTANTSPVCLYCIYFLFLLEKANTDIFWYTYVADWWTWSIHRKHPKRSKQVNMLQ